MSIVANSLTNQSTGQPIYANFISNPLEGNLDAGNYEIKNVATDPNNNTGVANVAYVKTHTSSAGSTIKPTNPGHIFSVQQSISVGQTAPHAQLLGLLPSPILTNPAGSHSSIDAIIEPQLLHSNGYITIDQELNPSDGISIQFYLVMVRGTTDVFDVFSMNPSHTIANASTTYWSNQHRIPFNFTLLWDRVYPAFENNIPLRPGLWVYVWKKDGDALKTIKVNPDPSPTKSSVIALTFTNATPIPNNPTLSLSQVTPAQMPAIPHNHTRILQIHPSSSLTAPQGVQAIQKEMLAKGYFDYNRATSGVHNLGDGFVLSITPLPSIIPPVLPYPSAIRLYEKMDDGLQRLRLYMTPAPDNKNVYVNTGSTTSSPHIYNDKTISLEIAQKGA